MDKNTQKKILAAILLVILAALAIYIFTLNRAVVLKYYGEFETFVKNTGVFGASVFVMVVVVKVLVPVFPSEHFELLAGAVYGAWLGGLLCHLGVLIGGLIIYFLGKKLNWVLVEKLKESTLKTKVEELKSKKGFDKICMLLLFLPGTPKEVLMIILCTIGIDFKKYLFYITVLRIPAVFSSTITGALAGDGRFLFAILLYGVTFLLAAGGYYYHKRITK